MSASLRLVLLAGTMFAAQPVAAQESVDAAKIEALEKQIQALQAQLDEVKKQLPKAVPSWRGAPQFEDKADGWSFKPRGRMHYDTGYVGIPGDYAVNRNLGFGSKFRRMRIGAEGTMPGGFGYKVEVDFANAQVSFGDIVGTWTNTPGTLAITAGNFSTLSSLERITSSNVMTFQERAQMNDAFGHSRRLGVAAGLADAEGLWRFDAGAFAGETIDNSFDQDGWIAAARAVHAPKALGGQLHFGINYQHREFQSNDGGTTSIAINAPSTNQLARYRARPFTQITDVRFVDTGLFAARGDDVLGIELGGVFGSVYFSGEGQWVKVDGYRGGDIATGLDIFSNGNIAVVPTGDPTFFSGYGEIGWFITGEKRGYGQGAWQRTRVRNPLSKGGSGAFQLAARIDWLDLDSGKLKNGPTNNFSTGATSLAPVNSRLARGGTQMGYLLGLNWYPVDYVRFMLNYARIEVEGGPLAAIVKPLSTVPIDERSYGTDFFALRAQVEF